MARSVVVPAAPHDMFHRVGAAPHQMMRPSTPAAPEEHALRLSDLERLGDLGKGGFAQVSKVRHRRTGAVFALKESLRPDAVTDDEVEVLRRAAGRPHVVDWHTTLYRPDDGLPMYVLEFMNAGSLGRIPWRRSGLGMPEPALAEVAAQCVMGLAQLHSRGIAHLDVKPDNLLANSLGEIKISDFNTSKILYGGAGERLQVFITGGTSCYFSPERFAPKARAGPQVAMAADVWSLGITILELFLGRFVISPDSGKAYFSVLKEVICHGEPPSVPEDAKASAELRGFVAACLHKEPTQRITVPKLLSHPFITRRDVVVSKRALQELIVESM